MAGEDAGAPSKNLRVLFLTRSYPTPAAPVVAPFTRDHALAAARFADVHVLHTQKTRDPLPGLWKVEEDDDGVPVCRVRFRRLPGKSLSHLLHLGSALRGLKHVLRRFRPDLIDGVIDGECRAKLLSLLLPRPQ